MALGRQGVVQEALLIGWHEMPSAPGHGIYDRLKAVLDEAGFDREVEALCALHYASRAGRPSMPPGRYFRMLFATSKAWTARPSPGGAPTAVLAALSKLGPARRRPITARCRGPGLGCRWKSTRGVRAGAGPAGGTRADQGRARGRGRPTLEANAAMRTIVRREDGAGWQAMLGELAKASGLATPSADQLRQSDPTRTGKRVSSRRPGQPGRPAGADHRLRMADLLGLQAEHVVDLDSGAILAAAVHPGDAGDTRSFETTLEIAASNLETVEPAPKPEAPARRQPTRATTAGRSSAPRGAGWTTGIAEPACETVLRWHGDDEARRAVYANRRRLLSGIARAPWCAAVLCERTLRMCWIAAACAAARCAAGRTSPALPDARRRLHPRVDHARAVRCWHPQGGNRPRPIWLAAGITSGSAAVSQGPNRSAPPHLPRSSSPPSCRQRHFSMG